MWWTHRTGDVVEAISTMTLFFMKTSNGRNPLPYFYTATHTNAACHCQSYPKDVTGVMALSTSPYALPAYFNQQPLNRTFSLCIPSASAAPGILFYGNGPYYFLPHSDVDGGKKWTISTVNSIKHITENVACLAFIDGGAKSEHAIVIGTHQFRG
ncbi:basic 7S globulin-like protein [Tanacetum coccineum]